MKTKLFVGFAVLLAALFVVTPGYAQGYKWDLADTNAENAGWVVIPDEFWEYRGSASLSIDTATFGKPMLKFDVDFTQDSGKDWSEPKIKYVFKEPVELRGVRMFAFDFYYNPGFMKKGHLKSKVIALTGTRSITDSVSGLLNSKEEVNGFIKVPVTLRITRSTRTMDNTILSIAGYLTDYKGPVFFDNLRWE